MSSLLVVKTSINGDNSISNGYANAFVTAWKEKNVEGSVVERDLQKTPPALLDAEAVYAGYTPEADRSESQKAKFGARLELVAEITTATDIIIASPMWNWSCPAALKAWIDAIIIPGTMGPGEGTWSGKKVTFVISQGGSYSEGSGKEGWDHQSAYLLMFAKALGATDVELIFSELGLAGIAPGMEGLVDKKAENVAAATAKVVARAKDEGLMPPATA